MAKLSRSAGPNFSYDWEGATVSKNVGKLTEGGMNEMKEPMRQSAWNRAPKLTQSMADSIEGEVVVRGGKRTLRLGVNLDKLLRTASQRYGRPVTYDYSLPNELGSAGRPARPFLRPTLDEWAPKLTRYIQAEAKKRGMLVGR